MLARADDILARHFPGVPQTFVGLAVLWTAIGFAGLENHYKYEWAALADLGRALVPIGVAILLHGMRYGRGVGWIASTVCAVPGVLLVGLLLYTTYGGSIP